MFHRSDTRGLKALAIRKISQETSILDTTGHLFDESIWIPVTKGQ